MITVEKLGEMANDARLKREKPCLSIYSRGFYDGYAAALTAVEVVMEED